MAGKIIDATLYIIERELGARVARSQKGYYSRLNDWVRSNFTYLEVDLPRNLGCMRRS